MGHPPSLFHRIADASASTYYYSKPQPSTNKRPHFLSLFVQALSTLSPNPCSWSVSLNSAFWSPRPLWQVLPALFQFLHLYQHILNFLCFIVSLSFFPHLLNFFSFLSNPWSQRPSGFNSPCPVLSMDS